MYIGFDIGGTNIKHGILNSLGEIIEKGMTPTNHDRELLLSELTTITKEYAQNYEINGIGISVPGIIQKDGFMLTGGAIKSLYGINLKDEMELRTELPTAIENDANAAAIAEKWIGNAIEIDNYLCVVLGTGMGGGIVINGQIYRGAHGMAGEFGYMMTHKVDVSRNIEESSLNWTGAVVGGLYRQYYHALLAKDPSAQPITDASEIMLRANSGELEAVNVMSQYYQDVAVGIINLIGAFDPEVILIGGGISANKEFMKNLTLTINDLEEKHESINYLKGKTIAPVIPAKLRNDAGLLGAVYQIKQKLLEKISLPNG